MSDEKKSSDKMFHILYVDDDSALNFFSELMLRGLGYEVDFAAYGPTALKKLNEKHYDLMITDMFLPEMNGAELIRAVRKAGKNLPILIISLAQIVIWGDVAHIHSGRAFPEFLETHLFDGFINKPFTVEELEKEVSKLLAI